MVWMVSFEPKLHNEFQKMRESGESVKVSNCCVQHSKQSDELEVVVGSRTSITKSSKKFVINEELNASCNNNYSAAVPDVATLAEVAGMSVNQQINVRGKVISVDAPEKLHTKTRDEILCKQDFTIAD